MESPGGTGSPPRKKSNRNIDYEIIEDIIGTRNLSQTPQGPLQNNSEAILAESNPDLTSQNAHAPEQKATLTESAFNPEFNSNETIYTAKDKTPFTVYIESTEKSGNNIGGFNHLKIAKDIFDLKLSNILKINIKGRNRLGVDFDSFKAANNFLQNKHLKNLGYDIFIPKNYTSCKGIVRAIPKMFSMKTIVQNSTSRECRVISCTRLNRKVIDKEKKSVEYIPTTTVLYTFEGTRLPRDIQVFGLDMQIKPYVPPVTQCFNCFRYGHTKKICKSKKKCLNCGSLELENETPHRKEDGSFLCQIKCILCNSDEHRSSSKTCMEFERQLVVKKAMAFDNLTYFEANEKYKSFNSNTPFSPKRGDFPEVLAKPHTEKCPYSSQEKWLNTTRRKQTYAMAAASNKTNTNNLKKQKEDILYFPNSRPRKYQDLDLPTNSSSNIIIPQTVRSTGAIPKNINASTLISPTLSATRNFNKYSNEIKTFIEEMSTKYKIQTPTECVDQMLKTTRECSL